MADGYEELDERTASVIDESAEVVDESRRLLRRLDHLLAGGSVPPDAGEDAPAG